MKRPPAAAKVASKTGCARPPRYASFPLRVINSSTDYKKARIEAGMIVYWFMDVEVVDERGRPVEGAEVKVKCEQQDVVVTKDRRRGKEKERRFYLVMNLKEEEKATFITGKDGHTPLPPDLSGTALVADYYEKAEGRGPFKIPFTYTVTASKDNVRGEVNRINPDARWYRPDSQRPTDTVKVVVKLSGDATMEGKKSENLIGEGKIKKYEWKAVGKYDCYGVPDVHQDPNNPDNYIITWQRYTRRAGRTVQVRPTDSRPTIEAKHGQWTRLLSQVSPLHSRKVRMVNSG